MGKEASDFVHTLALKISEKDNEPYALVSSWLRTKLSFEILKSALLCVRGSRTPFRKQNFEEYVSDFRLNSYAARVQNSKD